MARSDKLLAMPQNTDEETLSLSYTCGVCETICYEHEISCHPCLKGYNHFYVDKHSHFYPQCDDGESTNSFTDCAEANVVEKTQLKNKEADVAATWQNTKLLQEEQIIEEVRKRPALWNFKLPLAERSLKIKKKLWEEIFASMNGTMDIASIKKKWKSLCDSFRMHKNKQQHQPSGSAGTSRRSSWLHYDRMQFLCDAQLESETASNIPASETYEEPDQFNDDDSNSSGRGSRGSKRHLSIDTSAEETLERLTNALNQPVTVNIPPFMPNLPSPTDKAALFGDLIAAQLRELDPHLIDDAMLKVMQTINTIKSNNRK